MRILCSGYLVRFPLGGLSWHHLQYVVGLQRLGHEVFFAEEHGWPRSCFDPARRDMTADPTYGIRYLRRLLRPFELEESWCYLGEDGTAYGMSREKLTDVCQTCDLYIDLSNINRIPETDACRRRVLVDTDPVFTQIGSQGRDKGFTRYDVLFTFGENVHAPEGKMPTAGHLWEPTRQPVVLDLWTPIPGSSTGRFTTVMSWSPIEDSRHSRREYGQKDRSFEPYFELPRLSGQPMEVAVDPPASVRERLASGGWSVRDPVEVTRRPADYQRYILDSCAEFSVAKHGYAVTECGWFSERSAGYLASGRPVIVQDTGFSRWLPTGEGVLPFKDLEGALERLVEVKRKYRLHCRRAREIVAAYFDSNDVLSSLLERATSGSTATAEPDTVRTGCGTP